MKSKILANLIWLMVIGCGCMRIEQSVPPTPPHTLPELIDALYDYSADARMGAAGKLGTMGVEAAPAVPALIDNLNYEGVYDVRAASARALGRIGPPAKPAVPALVVSLQSDSVHVRRIAAGSLGQIGDTAAIPALAETLYDEKLLATATERGVMIASAEAIEILTNQEFSGRQGSGYMLTEDEIPLIVLAAKAWWEKEGQYLEWPELEG